MILLATAPDDPTANFVVTLLRARRLAFRRFNPADFPATTRVTVGIDATGTLTATLHLDREGLDLRRVSAIWFRRPEAPRAPAAIVDAQARRYIEQECGDHLRDLWIALRAPCFPAAPPVVACAEHKAAQLVLAGELGFDLSPTLITTDPDALLAFHRANDGHIVSKVAGPAFNLHFGPERGRYTEVVAPRDLVHAASVRHAPSMFQGYIPKRLELRVTVVGTRVFAAEIDSQAATRTRHDWRRYDLGHTPHRPHDLPRDVERRCVDLVRRLGLNYGAIDLVLTPDERYVFLEINPNGQYLWIEQMTGLPISEAIVDWFAARQAAHSSRDAA